MTRMSASDHETLLERLRRCLDSRPHVLEAYLFGSHGRQDAQPHSDVDVAVFLDTDALSQPPFGYAAELTTELAKALGCNTVDVVILTSVPRGGMLIGRIAHWRPAM